LFAARRCCFGTTQPAVSKKLKELEDTSWSQALERSKRGVELRLFANVFLETCKHQRMPAITMKAQNVSLKPQKNPKKKRGGLRISASVESSLEGITNRGNQHFARIRKTLFALEIDVRLHLV